MGLDFALTHFFRLKQVATFYSLVQVDSVQER